ncbi:hypothetical protein FISHEDRAFT_63459 [Fistulina hepatica ATCC 64428]|uniref:Uncharacterized protein n=1 Tax=Fistulina hepatica ATCC 64428 TaxID=1128425 RepID=A0A0D7AN73_9AGAR|nr:hypothetical protein FISHEDRAFT_63459 [Fistulina hepatica ATCC 64428]
MANSGILLFGQNFLQSLVPATLISRIESLLEEHRVQDAVDLADQQRRKLEGNLKVKEQELDELRYVYQRIGFQCFTETLFEDAGNHLFNGEVDPRLLISYFPDLRGNLFADRDSLDVFSGVVEHMPRESSVDDIIVSNIVRNYSPHMSHTAPPTTELHHVMSMAARDMLEVFLRKCRVRRGLDPITKADRNPSSAAMENGKDTELQGLVADPHHRIVLSEIEPVLHKARQYGVLCTLLQQHDERDKLLEIWSQLVDGRYMADDVPDPLGAMVSALSTVKDRTVVQTWALWMVKRNRDLGMKLLILARDTGKRRERPEEDIALLERICEADEEAGQQYLEYLVLQRRHSSRELHARLAALLVGAVFKSLEDEAVFRLWRAKSGASSSSTSKVPTTPSPFISYFSSTTPDSPHKRARLKAALFLQGSDLYNFATVREQLVACSFPAMLGVEIAIVEGKLGNHEAALSMLAREVHDAASAEAYCALGGDVITPRTATVIAADLGPGWASWSSTPAKTGAGAAVDPVLRAELIKILLRVYMSPDPPALAHVEARAANLLNGQGKTLDALDVIALVPPPWPLRTVSSFLARSFRQLLHERHEGKLVKSISSGQNLACKDRVWPILREEGMWVEEASEDTDAGDTDEYIDEKTALSIHDTVAPVTDKAWTNVADVHVE